MLRWPIIRHIRYLWLAWQFHRWTAIWETHGYFPNENDIEHLRRVWKGEA